MLTITLLTIACTVVCGCGRQSGDKLPKIGRASEILCGGKLLIIPPPPDMIRSDGIHPAWDDTVAASLPPKEKLLAYYSTFEDRVRIERQAPPASDRDCILRIREADLDRNVTSWGLGGLEDDIDDDMELVLKDVGTQLAKLLSAGSTPEVDSSGETAAFASSTTAANASLLGWFGNTKHSFGYTIGLDLKKGDGSTLPMVSSTSVALVNGRMLSFQATTSEGGDAARAWAENTAFTWSSLAVTANKEYNAPSWIWRGIKLALLIALIIGLVRGTRYLIRMKKQVQEEVKEDERREAALKDII
ncbi:MAG: hypothetical protein R3F19_32285 [Verrucomicrobiales bacterium]